MPRSAASPLTDLPPAPDGLRNEFPQLLWGALHDTDWRRGFDVRLRTVQGGCWLDTFYLTVTPKVSEEVIGAKASFDARMIRTASANLAHVRFVVNNTVLGLAREVAPKLYEHDPRIGTLFTGVNGDPLPECPLFDRPDGNDRAQETLIRGSLLKGVDCTHPRWPVGNQIIPMTCPFCRESLYTPATGRSVMWAGGNLCWVHAVCWDKRDKHG